MSMRLGAMCSKPSITDLSRGGGKNQRAFMGVFREAIITCDVLNDIAIRNWRTHGSRC